MIIHRFILSIILISSICLISGCGSNPGSDPDASTAPPDGNNSSNDADTPLPDAATPPDSVIPDAAMPDAPPALCGNQPDGTPCGSQEDTACDHPDVCMGGQCLTNFEPAGTACGDLTDDECTNPDTCDGAGLCSANNAPVGTACGDPTDGDCTDPDACDGAGLCQQNNSPIGAACGDSSNNDCTDPDTCNGAGICLDNHEADGLTCDDCPAGPGMCATCAAGACPDALVCTSAYALPTTFASNGALDGNMFDVRVLSTTISITSIDVNLNTGTHTIEIWYRSGSYLGYEETPAGWNLLTMVSGVTSNGPDVATPVPVSPNLVIPAGGTYALYITTQTSGGMRYTGSTDEGSVYASDTRIEILEGVGKQWPFSGTLRPRVFNGTLHYRVCP